MKERIGFIGVGLMGHGMAKNIVEKGWPLTVLARRKREAVDDLKSRGAKEASSPRAVADASDIVVLCVTGSPQVEAIVRGRRARLGGKAAHDRRLLDLGAGFDAAPRRDARAEGDHPDRRPPNWTPRNAGQARSTEGRRLPRGREAPAGAEAFAAAADTAGWNATISFAEHLRRRRTAAPTRKGYAGLKAAMLALFDRATEVYLLPFYDLRRDGDPAQHRVHRFTLLRAEQVEDCCGFARALDGDLVGAARATAAQGLASPPDTATTSAHAVGLGGRVERNVARAESGQVSEAL